MALEAASIWVLCRRERLVTLVIILLLLLLAGSLFFYIFEHPYNPQVRTIWDALYWGVVSITTVGYGDVTPFTAYGKIAAAIMTLSCVAIMPILAATITSIYITRRLRGDAGLDKVIINNHIVICGWNNNGYSILTGLSERGGNSPVVIVTEINAEHFENISSAYPELQIQFVKGPFTNEAVLQRANVRQARAAIVLINYGQETTIRSDEQAVMAVLTLRELAPSLHIVVECFASSYYGHLRRAGANRVIVSGELDGFMLTAAALSPGLDTSIKDALSFASGNELWTTAIPAEFAGKVFRELALRWLTEKGWIVVGLVRATRKLGIKDVLASDSSNIDEFITRKFEQAGKGQGGAKHSHFLNPGLEHVIEAGDRAIVIFPAEAEHG